MSGQAITTNGQRNRQTSTTSGKTGPVSRETITTSV